MENNFDFIAIGDITIDNFIRLEDESAHSHIDKGNLELCVNFGDKIPYEFTKEIFAVGNSPNASVSASRLGLKSAIITNLGDDENGKKCLEKLKSENVDTKYIKVHNGKNTNYHYVLWFEDERTILVRHEEYEYKLPDFGTPKWVYLSSVSKNTEKFHEEIISYLAQKPEIKLAFQPGTFQIRLGRDKLKDVYERSEILALNKKEAKHILDIKTEDNETLLHELKKLGPKNILMTDGKKGAYFYNGEKIIFAPTEKDSRPPYERTGAGDAYSSTFISALIMGKDVKQALSWASINSASVIQKIGAQEGLMTRKEIEKKINN